MANLNETVEKLTEQNRELYEKLQDRLNADIKSARNTSDKVVPLYKPLHAKTLSIIEMVKQYSNANASQQPTQRMVPDLKAEESF